MSCNRGGFLSIFIVGGTFASFCFVTLVGVLTVTLHIFVMVSFSLRYAPASDLLLVLCCFVLRRVLLTLKAVEEASPGILYYMEYVYTLCVVTGVRFLTRTIPLRNMNSPCVAAEARIRRVYSYGICIRCV